MINFLIFYNVVIILPNYCLNVLHLFILQLPCSCFAERLIKLSILLSDNYNLQLFYKFILQIIFLAIHLLIDLIYNYYFVNISSLSVVAVLDFKNCGGGTSMR